MLTNRFDAFSFPRLSHPYLVRFALHPFRISCQIQHRRRGRRPWNSSITPASLGTRKPESLLDKLGPFSAPCFLCWQVYGDNVLVKDKMRNIICRTCIQISERRQQLRGQDEDENVSFFLFLFLMDEAVTCWLL